MSTAFGNALRERRRASGISQRRLAEMAGVDFSYISKLENGRLPAPAAETILRIALSIKSPPEELLAAAQKLPDDIGSALSANPAAVRFVQEASALKLTEPEWEQMRGTLKSLRESNQGRTRRS
ncbi:MAG: helix-turn-helix transcriptional regulator [Phycisphaerales bacterium]|nr:helix-turn-helix transcriptional regulator [Phycisphaerales bacterium]